MYLFPLSNNLPKMLCSKTGVAKSQKCILVHGQMVLEKHLSVPMHYLSVLLQIQFASIKNGLISKIMIKLQISCLTFCKTFTTVRISEIK